LGLTFRKRYKSFFFKATTKHFIEMWQFADLPRVNVIRLPTSFALKLHKFLKTSILKRTAFFFHNPSLRLKEIN